MPSAGLAVAVLSAWAVGFAASAGWLWAHPGPGHRRPGFVACYAAGAVPFSAAGAIAAGVATRATRETWTLVVVVLFATWAVATLLVWTRSGGRGRLTLLVHALAGAAAMLTVALWLPGVAEAR